MVIIPRQTCSGHLPQRLCLNLQSHRSCLPHHRVLTPPSLPAVPSSSPQDMDPEAPAFQRIVNNPMLFALFKSTEPWLQDYVSLELTKELREAGFKDIEVRSNSPRHRTVVAVVDK